MLWPRVTDVQPLPDYHVQLRFETDEIKILDVKPYIYGEKFEKLLNERYFGTVHIANGTIEWAGGQDIAPHELYDLSIPVTEE